MIGKRHFMSLIAISAICTAVAASQETLPAPRQRMMEGERLMARLNLTEEQRKEMEKLRVEMAKEAISQQAKLKTARLELAELFKADSPDKGMIEKKLSEVAQIESKSKLLFVNHWFSVNKLLNAEQQKIWKRTLGRAWMQQRANRMRGVAPGPELRDRMRRFQQERPPMGRFR